MRQVSDGKASAVKDLAALLREASKDQLHEYVMCSESMLMGWLAIGRVQNGLQPLMEAFESRMHTLKLDYVSLLEYEKELGY